MARSRNDDDVIVDRILGAVVEWVEEEFVFEGDAESDDVGRLQEEVVVAEMVGMAMSGHNDVDVVLE